MREYRDHRAVFQNLHTAVRYGWRFFHVRGCSKTKVKLQPLNNIRCTDYRPDFYGIADKQSTKTTLIVENGEPSVSNVQFFGI